MDTSICPNTPKCPIFSGVLKGSIYTETYKEQYCLAGEEGRQKCKRYLIAQAVGKCPANVLPNAFKSVDEIIEDMRKKGEI